MATYDHDPTGRSERELELVPAMGEYVCKCVATAEDVVRTTGILGYELLGTVALKAASKERPYEEFVMFQSQDGTRFGVTRSTMPLIDPQPSEILTLYPKGSVAVVPADDFRFLVTLNRRLAAAPYSTLATWQDQKDARKQVRTLTIQPGRSPVFIALGSSRSYNHGWPELKSLGIDRLHCVIRLRDDGRVFVESYGEPDTVFIRQRRENP